ncbi:MAG: metal ABC transporter solute-binding protein, Zn/Mn family [Candidatus Humimicrobiaceae bacterium]
MFFNKKIVLFLLSFLFLMMLIPVSCSPESLKEGNKGETINIIVSIPPQAEFVEAICGNRAVITIMVPSGASPHTYEPKPAQLVGVSDAVLYVKVGTPVEFEINWLEKITDLNKNMAVADCSKNIELIEIKEEEHDEKAAEENNGHSHHGADPHIWLSLKNAILMTENIYDAVISLDPENKDYYKKNKDEYVNKIKKLDERIHDLFENAGSRVFMSYHDSWAYFARDYGLTQLTIEEEGKEPSPKKIKELIDLAESGNIRVIFASPELNYSSANIIAEGIGGSVILISPLEKDYLKNMEKMGDELNKQLKK